MIFVAKDNIIWQLEDGTSLEDVVTKELCKSFNEDDVKYIMDSTFLDTMESLYYCVLSADASREAITNLGNIDGLITLSLTTKHNAFSLHLKCDGIRPRGATIHNITRVERVNLCNKNIDLQASNFTNTEWGIILKALNIKSAQSITASINATVIK